MNHVLELISGRKYYGAHGCRCGTVLLHNGSVVFHGTFGDAMHIYNSLKTHFSKRGGDR